MKKIIPLYPTFLFFFFLFILVSNMFCSVYATTNLSHSILQSSEDSIDSFTVNPESGRWNTTESNYSNTYISNNGLQIDSTNNDSSTLTESYKMNRKLKLSSDKLDLNFKHYQSNQNNTIDYFTTVKDDSCDFTEDNEGFDSYLYPTSYLGNSNGIGEWNQSNAEISYTVIRLNFSNILSLETLVNFQIRLKCSSDLITTIALLAYCDNNFTKYYYTDYITITSYDWSNWNTLTITKDQILDNSAYNPSKQCFAFRIALYNWGDIFPYNTRFYIDWIKLNTVIDYASFDDGDIEDTWDFEEDGDAWYSYGSGVLSSGYQDGYCYFHCNGSGVMYHTGLTIDTSIYTTLQFRIYCNISGIDYTFGDYGSATYYAPTFKTKVGWNTEIYDLSLDPDWNGLIVDLLFRISNTSKPQFEIRFDYILLTANYEEQLNSKCEFGLYSSYFEDKLLAISSNLYNKSLGYFTLELYDENNEIAYYYYSNNYSIFDNTSYRFIVDYDIRQSQLQCIIYENSFTKLLTLTFNSNLEIGTGKAPLLFSEDRYLEIYFNSYLCMFIETSIIIDSVKAKFSDLDFRLTYTESVDSNWVTQSALSNIIIDDATAEYMNYQLVIPNLDSISGLLYMKRNASITTYSYFIGLRLFNVAKSNGSLVEVSYLWLLTDNTGSAFTESRITTPDGYDNIQRSATSDWINSLGFSFSLYDDRNRINIQSKFHPDGSDLDTYYQQTHDINISEINDDYSNEFVLQIEYYCGTLNGNHQVQLLIQDFGFTSYDWFTDIIFNPINAIIGLFSAILFSVVGLITFVFKSVINPITDVLIGIIFDILSNIFSILGTVSSVLSDIISFLLTFITNIIDALIDALSDILENIIIVLNTLIELILTFIANCIFAFWEGIWSFFGVEAPNLLEIASIIVSMIITIVLLLPEGIVDVLTFIIGIAPLFLAFIFLLIMILAYSKQKFVLDFIIYLFINEICAFDITCGLGILGFKIKIPFGLVFYGLVIVLVILPNISLLIM